MPGAPQIRVDQRRPLSLLFSEAIKEFFKRVSVTVCLSVYSSVCKIPILHVQQGLLTYFREKDAENLSTCRATRLFSFAVSL